MTKFAPLKALKFITWGKLTFDERVVVHRVARRNSTQGVQIAARSPDVSESWVSRFRGHHELRLQMIEVSADGHRAIINYYRVIKFVITTTTLDGPFLQAHRVDTPVKPPWRQLGRKLQLSSVNSCTIHPYRI